MKKFIPLSGIVAVGLALTATATIISDRPNHPDRGSSRNLHSYGEEKTLDPKAPAAVSNFRCEMISYGTVSMEFDVPDKTVDGSRLSVSGLRTAIGIKYEDADGFHDDIVTEMAAESVGVHESGTHSYSQFDVPGEKTIYVYLINGYGAGEVVECNVYSGADKLIQPMNVSLSYTDGKMSVSWKPVTGTVHGGYFDEENLSYTVTRYPDGNEVSGLKECSLIEDYPEPEIRTEVYYTVKAVSRLTESEAATSNNVQLGTVFAPPYRTVFESADDAEEYTVINANGDNNTWQHHYNGGMAYMYNSSEAADDWLITPGIRLAGGKHYDIGADLWSGGPEYPEKFSMCIGSSATVEGMVNTLIPETVVDSKTAKNYNASFTPETDGLYYVGFHVTSDADMDHLYLDNVSLMPEADKAAPIAPTVAVTPDPAGDLKALISFESPVRTIDGDEISNLTKAEIFRNDVANPIKVYTGGFDKPFSYEDKTIKEHGLYQYKVIFHNAAGAGEAGVAEAYVGINWPGAVKEVSIEETENPGEVKLTWPEVTEDIDGRPMNPEFINYDIMDEVSQRFCEFDVTSPYTFEPNPGSSEQSYAQFSIFAKSTAGYAQQYATSDKILIGKPYELPYAETFDRPGRNGYMARHFMEWENVRGSMEQKLTITEGDDKMLGQDDTGGYVRIDFKNGGDRVEIKTGRIAVSGLNPTLSFHYIGFAEDSNEITVWADDEDIDTELVKIGNVITIGEGEWKEAIFDMSSVAGKTVRLIFSVTCGYSNVAAIDNINIFNSWEHNIAIGNISAPDEVSYGSDFEITCELLNNGMNEADGYEANLYRNGELVQTISATTSIEPGQKTDVLFVEHLNPLTDSDSHEYKVCLSWDADANEDDNESEIMTVTVNHALCPAPAELQGEDGEEGILLKWKAPAYGVGDEPGAGNPDLKGYNIYSDGKLVNDDAVKTTRYTHVCEDGEHTYCVTAVYNHGESLPTETINITRSDVQKVVSDTCAVAVVAGVMHIFTVGEEYICIVGADGREVWSGTVNGEARVNIGSGIWIVKSGSRADKIIVK